MFGLKYVSNIDTLCRRGHNALVCPSVKCGQSHQIWGGPRAAPLRTRVGDATQMSCALPQQVPNQRGSLWEQRALCQGKSHQLTRIVCNLW